MDRRDLLRALMATPLAGWLTSWASSAYGGAMTDGPNAADVYRKAFDWAESLRPEESERLRKFATMALDDRHVVALIQQARPALEAIREAATIDQCRWGTGTVTLDDIGKGHLYIVATNNVINVACLSARQHLESGRYRKALDDVFAGLTLAHRIGTGGVLFARILECGGERQAFQTLGHILPKLDRAAQDDLSQRLKVLPSPEPTSAAIAPESQFILGSIRAKLMAIGPVVEGGEWNELGFDEEQTETLKRLTEGDRDNLLAHLEATVPVFSELARRLDLPRPGCRGAR